MTILLGGAPTAQLPPIGKIKQSSLQDLQAALCYLGSLYNPEVRPNRLSYRRSGTPAYVLSSPEPATRCRGSSDAAQKPRSDLDAIRADAFERSYATRWLTALVARADQLDVGTEDATLDAESIVQQAAGLIALCAGTASAGTRSRVFAFDDPSDGGSIKVRLTDLPLDNQDYTSLGAQTWGGACLMADLLVQSPPAFALGPAHGRPLRVLELGAGTGLVGLAAGVTLATHCTRADIVLTDFHAAVLANLRNNAAANCPDSADIVRMSVHPLDWAELAAAPADALLPVPFDQPFDVVLGADIIYELEHARWIKACVEKLLRIPSAETMDAIALPHPEFHLVMPLRSTHAAESQTVEQVFPSASSVRGGADSPPEGGPVTMTLAIAAREVVVCEDFARGSENEVEYVHFTIAWV